MMSGRDDQPVLIARAIAGDTDALTELLAVHGPEIERKLDIARPWRAMLDTADVMQVTYLEAFLEIHRFEQDRAGSFSAWLNRLAQNNLRDALRGLARHKRPQPSQRIGTSNGAGSASHDQLLETLLSTSATASRTLRREEARAMLDRAIGQLPDDYADVIRAYDLQGLQIEEVARSLARSAGAVHMLRARAHQRLAELLGSAVFPSSGA